MGFLGPPEAGRKAGSTDLTHRCLTHDSFLSRTCILCGLCPSLSLPSALHQLESKPSLSPEVSLQGQQDHCPGKDKSPFSPGAVCIFVPKASAHPCPIGRVLCRPLCLPQATCSVQSLTCRVTLGKLLPSSLSEFLLFVKWT